MPPLVFFHIFVQLGPWGQVWIIVYLIVMVRHTTKNENKEFGDYKYSSKLAISLFILTKTEQFALKISCGKTTFGLIQ